MGESFDVPSQRRRVRMKRFEEVGFQRLNVQLRGPQDISRDPRLVEYFYTANIDIVEIAPTKPIRARVAQFPAFTFLHAIVPPVTVLWKRDFYSRGSAVILLARRGRLEFTGAESIVSRGLDVHLLLPGSTPMHIRATDSENELFSLSIPARFLHDLSLSLHPGADDGPIAPALLDPPCSFLASLCSLSIGGLRDAGPLERAAEEIVRTILRLIADERNPLERGLFSAAMEILSNDYPLPSLNADDIAQRLHVSTRTLQLAFREKSTTVSSSLRRIRAAAAANLIQEQPDLPRAEVAGMCGFGSVDSLYRAQRELTVDTTG